MLTTLDLVKAELRQVASNRSDNLLPGGDSDDEAYVIGNINTVTEMINNDVQLNRQFTPWLETRYYDSLPLACNGPIEGRILWIDDCFTVTGVVDNSTTIDLSNTLLLPRNDETKRRLKLTQGSWVYSTYDPEGAIEITGTWGYHSRPSLRWGNSSDTVQTNMNTTITTIDVSDAEGADNTGLSPRFSQGQLLKIDDEWMQITAITLNTSPTDDVLTVRRAMNGTVAATHAATTVIYSWRPLDAAQNFATRIVAMNYQRRGEFQSKKIQGISEITYPHAQTLPEYQRLLPYRKTAGIARV